MRRPATMRASLLAFLYVVLAASTHIDAAASTASYAPALQLYNSSSASYTTALSGVLVATRFDPNAVGTRVLAMRALQAVVQSITGSAMAASYYANKVYTSHMSAVALSGVSPTVGVAGCAAATADASRARDVGLVVNLPDVDTTDAGAAVAAILTPAVIAQVRWAFAVAVATRAATVTAADGGALVNVVPLPLPTSVNGVSLARSSTDASLPYSFCSVLSALQGASEPAEATYSPDDTALYRAEAQQQTHHGILGFLAAGGLLVMIVAVAMVGWTVYRREALTSPKVHLPSLYRQKMAARAV